MIKTLLLDNLAVALRAAAPQLNELAVTDEITDGFRLERPRNPEHGDYAVNVSFLARNTKMPPPKIAEVLAAQLSDEFFEVSVIGGYLNFKGCDALLLKALEAVLRSDSLGKNPSMAKEKILLEYVSANPTGPLHVGHGRWAALGDTLARIFRRNDAYVEAEFYINDAGVQMGNIAHSLWYRIHDKPFPEPKAGEKSPFYPGEYVIDLANKYKAKTGFPIDAEARVLIDNPANDPFEAADAEQQKATLALRAFVKQEMLNEQKSLLAKLGVTFDLWTSEQEALYDAGLVEKAFETLQHRKFTYECDGAVWFKSEELGDEKDRVLKKADGSFTYLMPDIAYHDEKFSRLNDSGKPRYNRLINIWGADHHGYIPRMKAAMQAMGHDPEQLEILLGQLVNLIVDGEKTRMGKRRRMLTLEDVIRDIGGMTDEESLDDTSANVQLKVRKGVDATRYWMVSKSADSTLDFDVDLAASASNENPVFYVQYAHARCCSILRNAVEASNNVNTGEEVPAYVLPDELSAFEQKLDAETLKPLLDACSDSKQHDAVKTLLLHLDGFETAVIDAGRIRAPHFITQYCSDLASNFHSFYNVCRVLTPEKDVTLARLMLIRAVQKTLAQALELLGVSAPEKM